MYEHTKNVNSYYFGEIGVDVSNDGTIYECRRRGFELLEKLKMFFDLYCNMKTDRWRLSICRFCNSYGRFCLWLQ